MTSPQEGGPRRYVRPYVLPQSLELLTGPVTGIVRLPRHLAWSGSAVYNLDPPPGGGRVFSRLPRILACRGVLFKTLTPPPVGWWICTGQCSSRRQARRTCTRIWT